MMERSKTMVHVLRISSNDLPNRLDEVAALFQKAWDDTPEEYRAEMSFYAWGHTDYDSGYAEFEAYYMRDETDEEMKDRIARTRQQAEDDLQRHELRAAQARAALQRL